MGIFSKKPRYALSDILKGLHNAVNSAQEMLQAQQVQNLTKFWQANDGAPVSQKLKVGDRELNVPLMSLVSHSHLEMDDVEIKFKAKIGDVATHSFPNKLESDSAISHGDLQMEMEGIKAPSLLIDRVDVDFQMEVTDTNTSKTTETTDVSSNISAKWFAVQASISGKVSSSRENTRTTNQTAKYQVHVSASQQPQTEGLSKLMDIMASCIEPIPNSNTPEK